MAVTSQILEQGQRNVVMHFTNDGAALETAVLKVDVSTLTPPAARVSILKAQWSVSGDAGAALEILWDGTGVGDALALSLPSASSDTIDFRKTGGLQNSQPAGFTGDVLFTVPVATPYSVTLWMKKKYD